MLGLTAAGLGLALFRARRRTSLLEQDRKQLALQLDRRINEIFSLQELSYVLAESLQLERVAEQVVRYTMRFLQADGAVVALAADDGSSLRVAGAEGSLRELNGRQLPADERTLVMRALRNERIEVQQEPTGGAAEPTLLIGDVEVAVAAAAPLRAHGFAMGALAVAGRKAGSFSAEDLWLLSTVTTHVAVVMANSRLFEMVRQAKEEWETAFNSLAEGIAVVNGTGRISRANRAFTRLVDSAAPALIGRPFWATVVGDVEGPGDLLAAAARGERPPPTTVRSATLHRVLRLTAAPLSEPLDGTATVILIEDVTEQRALEAQLIQNEKLAAVGQLVSGVAHELNNPLTSIAGLSEFLLERGSLTPSDREHLRVVHEQAERAGRIVQNLLTFARKGTPVSEGVDLNAVVDRTAALVAYDMRLRGVDLVQRLSGEAVTVRGNRYELQQVLLNLLTNAVHAVSALGPDSPRRIWVETDREGNQVIIRVRDSGPGIPPHLVSHLFTPFFTTKEPGKGTGLGLSISYGIVESHGGRLTHAPADAGGAEFTIALPFAPIEREAEEEAPRSPGPARGESGRAILLVDQDRGLHRTASALFGLAGHRVATASNGDEALQLVQDEDFDLVIADALATAKGGRFLDALQALRPDWRGRVLVAAPADGSAARMRQEGLRVVERPFTVRQLSEAAESLLSIPPPAPFGTAGR
jgi:two-component system NtrC family sensor kinase